MKKVRVLVVDDSATMRRLISEILSKDPEIEVIGGAPEPAIARNMIKEAKLFLQEIRLENRPKP